MLKDDNKLLLLLGNRLLFDELLELLDNNKLVDRDKLDNNEVLLNEELLHL